MRIARRIPLTLSQPGPPSHPRRDKMIAMQLGAVTYNVLKDMDLETLIKTLEATGFEAVELRTTHKHGVEPAISKAERERVKELFARSKVRLVSYGTTCEFQSPDPAERKKQIELGKQFVELAHDTGAWGVKVRPNGLPNGVSSGPRLDRTHRRRAGPGPQARRRSAHHQLVRALLPPAFDR